MVYGNGKFFFVILMYFGISGVGSSDQKLNSKSISEITSYHLHLQMLSNNN